MGRMDNEIVMPTQPKSLSGYDILGAVSTWNNPHWQL